MMHEDRDSELDEKQRRSLDEELVEALVHTHLGEDPDRTATRVRQVLESLSPRRRKVWPRRAWSYGMAATVLVALSVGFAVLMGPHQEAFAGIETMLERMAAVDQVYAIEVEPVQLKRPPRHRRGPRWRRNARPARWERYDGARLYVRGEQYALVLDSRGPRRSVRGFDGESHWNVGFPANHPAGADQSNAIDELLSHVRVDVYNLLQGVEADWDLSGPESVDDPQLGATLLYYSATPTSSSETEPALIEIWANPVDGQIHQMICSDVRLRHRRLRFDMCISLMATDDLPADWFTLSAHQ